MGHISIMTDLQSGHKEIKKKERKKRERNPPHINSVAAAQNPVQNILIGGNESYQAAICFPD